MIKAVIFGLWETLGTKNFSASKILQDHFSIENTSDFLNRYEKSLHLKKWDSKEQMARSFLEEFNISLNKENINFVSEVILRGIKTAKIFEGFINFLRELKNKYQLAILSNTTNFEAEVLDKWQVGDLFNLKIYPWKTSFLKPSKESFDEVCRRLNVHPSECIFIDNEERSTEAAIKYGFNVIRFKNIEDMKQRLKNIERSLQVQ